MDTDHTVSYFLGTRLCGTSRVASDYGPHSLALFCQSCGDIWFRAVADGGPHWDVHHAVCERHHAVSASNWNRIPGTVGLGIKRDLPKMRWGLALDILSLSLLEREFILEHDKLLKESE